VPAFAELDSDEDEDRPLVEDGDEEEDFEEEEQAVGVANGGDIEMADAEGDESRIVLHEDKKYYPTAIEVYGEGVRASPASRLPRADPRLTGGLLRLARSGGDDGSGGGHAAHHAADHCSGQAEGV
jgi:hypothetical protein